MGNGSLAQQLPRTNVIPIRDTKLQRAAQCPYRNTRSDVEWGLQHSRVRGECNVRTRRSILDDVARRIDICDALDPNKFGPNQGGYWLYPTMSDTPPVGGLTGTPGAQTAAENQYRPIFQIIRLVRI